MSANTVAFILKGYPRLSETFIAQEIQGLEARGLDIVVYALRHPTDRARHPVHDEIRAPVHYLPEYLHRAPLRLLRAWRAVRRRPGYGAARRLWLADLAREGTRNRVRRFGQALMLAHALPAEVGRLHAHFLHTPASVARYASHMTGLPWSASAHAKDIWTTPDWEKAEKLADLDWLAVCTAAGRDHLAAVAPDPGRVHLHYHGLDLERFAPAPAARLAAPGQPVVILSVGRAVPKKGYADLIDALATLADVPGWRLVHVGGGPLLPALKRRATQKGLAARITWCGPLAHEAVLAHYRAADLFVLASRIAPDGDRDGLPNVLLEAQSQGLACVATRVSAIPELIRDTETGVLVPPGDPAALGAALADLIHNGDRRAALGAAAERRVRAAFSHEAELDALAARFGRAVPAAVGRCASPSTHR